MADTSNEEGRVLEEVDDLEEEQQEGNNGTNDVQAAEQQPLSAQQQAQLAAVDALVAQATGVDVNDGQAQEAVGQEAQVNQEAQMNQEAQVNQAPDALPPAPVKIDAYEQTITGEQTRELAKELIHKYFTSQTNPLTRHHIESYDQFLQRDMKAIIRAQNPLILLKNPRELREMKVANYKYRVEIYIGGEDGNDIFIGTPTIALDQGHDVRVLFPNESRLRNLTYAVQIHANILVRVMILQQATRENPRPEPIREDIVIPRYHLCNFPLMLHSSFCMLHAKPPALLTQMGECQEDQGGYFIIDGSEKVLVTRQEGAFNTLWISEQSISKDPAVQYYASISSLNPVSREVKRVSFYWTREAIKAGSGLEDQKARDEQKKFGELAGERINPAVLEVGIPFVLKPIPIFVLFRALGVQSDKDILKQIFPDFESPEALYLADLLTDSINQAAPFLDSYSAVQYIKTLTKGFSEFHVLDIVHNHLFPHVEDRPGARVAFLADCVRRILRVVKKVEAPLSRDDTRYQRLLTSGFLCQMLFQNCYKLYTKKVLSNIDEMFSYNESTYSNEKFLDIFADANRRTLFAQNFMTEKILRGFKGKWLMGPSTEESGLLQELSRLSYLDFMSHLRHAILHFDTSMKLQNPRRLNPSQYGYFCTSETPSGASIGITKNLTIMTFISTGTYPDALTKWLFSRGAVVPCEHITPELARKMVPVYVNSGIVGYTGYPKPLARVLKMMKRSGFLPPLSSNGFSIPERKIFIFLDEGRPLRPLIVCERQGYFPPVERFKGSWRDMVVGTLRPDVSIGSREFTDPLADEPAVNLNSYLKFFEQHQDKLGIVEYIDPYEQNEVLVANMPEHILKQTTHVEVHPSTILGLLGNCIPYPNHNQSPRNQLSASQSKQALSLYATNWYNRFDNTANVLCYGEAPLCRTIYQDYFGHGRMPYGQNIILAMGMFGGYNQEDGIIMNLDALERGQFRSLNYRSYEAFEEDDQLAQTKTRIGNPRSIPGWTNLKPNLDYSKLDESGLIKIGEYVDQNTVIVGRYMQGLGNQFGDASVTPKVWTKGRVQDVVVTVNNMGLRLVKVRVVQDRRPELGDKKSNRHGQKGTINVLYRAQDMPRTADGITPDMIMNPTAIPSRMTIGQILEMIMGNAAAHLGALGDVTAFMNDGSPHEMLGKVLERLGLNRMCNQVLYNGATGEQIQADIFMGIVYGMRLKHMTEDKWNARGEGRKEQRTHQPTGGRGNEGGLKLGELERDAICAHGVSSFLHESFMKRSDGTHFMVCNGCGTIPIYNERQDLYICGLCDGPIQFSGDNASNLDPIPPPTRSGASFSKIEMPYATKLFMQELDTFLNLGMRILTTHDTQRLRGMDTVNEMVMADATKASQPIPLIVQREETVPEVVLPEKAPTVEEVNREMALVEDTARKLAAAVTVDTAAAAAANTTPMDASVAQLAGVEVNQVSQAQQQAVVEEAANPLEGLPTAVQQNTMQQQLQAQPQQVNMAAGGGGGNDFVTATAAAPAPAAAQEVQVADEGGQPVISIDTSPHAMAAAGLNMPNDATGQVVAPVDALQQQQQAPRPRPRLYRAPRQPQQQPQMGGAYDEQEPPAQQYSGAPIKVVKLG
jgi:DNA-directed RNA polymerase II subunit RPB2